MKRKVILGVTASDAHVVGNHMIAFWLREKGFEVVNLGACTPVTEFAQAARNHPDAEAMLIGSLNGHAASDLQGLRDAKQCGDIRCPVLIGGNLSVGADKKESDLRRFFSLGVDHVLPSHTGILPLLDRLSEERRMRRAV